MKTILTAILIISVGIVTAYAGGFSMLHVGSADGNGGGGGGCSNQLDFSQACNSQYIPIIH